MKLNLPKFFHKKAYSLIDKLGAYKERTNKYVNSFKQFLDCDCIILDVGCGPGLFSKILAMNGRIVIALDVQKQSLKKIEHESIHRVCADAHNLPFRESSIGYVLSH